MIWEPLDAAQRNLYPCLTYEVTPLPRLLGLVVSGLLHMHLLLVLFVLFLVRPLRRSKEFVHVLKSCPAGYPRTATTLLWKLLLHDPVLELVFPQLPVKSGSSLGSTTLGKLQGA